MIELCELLQNLVHRAHFLEEINSCLHYHNALIMHLPWQSTLRELLTMAKRLALNVTIFTSFGPSGVSSVSYRIGIFNRIIFYSNYIIRSTSTHTHTHPLYTRTLYAIIRGHSFPQPTGGLIKRSRSNTSSGFSFPLEENKSYFAQKLKNV